jgi:hypothetical protein
MKYIASVLLFLLLSTVTRAQFSSAPVYTPQLAFVGLTTDSAATPVCPGRCTATKVGAITMAAGGGIIAAGVLALVTPWAKNHNDSLSNGYKNATAVAIVGGGVEIAGMLIYLLGKDKDRKAKYHYHMLLQGNKVGMAYNF